MIEIAAPYFELSQWNDRPLNDQALGKVVKNFFDDGCHYKRHANAIPVIVHRYEIDEESLIGPQDIPGKLKPVVWKARAAAVQIANGRHRREGHKEYMKRLLKRLEDAKSHVQMLTRSNAPAEDIRKATEYRDHEQEYFDSLGLWIAEFYDYGESQIVYESLYDLTSSSFRQAHSGASAASISKSH